MIVSMDTYQLRLRLKTMFAIDGEIQKFIDSSVLVGIAPYVPMRTGMLKKSATFNTKIGSGMIIWSTPYARYLYYGKVMIGSAPKTVTNKDLVFDRSRNPLAGAKWADRYMADRLPELNMMIQKKVGKQWSTMRKIS